MSIFSQRSVWLVFAIIVIAGAFFRVTASINTLVAYPLRADAGDYFSYAYNLKHFGVYSRAQTYLENNKVPVPDALRPPGYPLMLWWFASETPTGKTILNITLFQALLGMGMVLMVFFLGRQFLPPGWALLPAALVAISPQLILAGTYVLSESLFSLLLLMAIGSVLFQYRFPERSVLALLSGVAIGLATLTRPTLQYFILFLLPVMWTLLPAHMRWRHALLTLLGFAVVFAPWLVRNHWVLGASSDATLTINALVHGHYPNMMFENNPRSLGFPYRFDPELASISSSVSAAVTGIFKRVMAAPGEYLQWYLLGKPLAFFSWKDPTSANSIFIYGAVFSPYYHSLPFIWTKDFMQLTHAVWVVLALLSMLLMGLFHAREEFSSNERVAFRLLVTTSAYFVALHMVAFPLARYCVPLLPVIFLLATWTLWRVSLLIKNNDASGVVHES
ncbi:MAG TPA: glycosyltransferase family 39 protein [Pseudomonadales bacterium]